MCLPYVAGVEGLIGRSTDPQWGSKALSFVNVSMAVYLSKVHGFFSLGSIVCWLNQTWSNFGKSSRYPNPSIGGHKHDD